MPDGKSAQRSWRRPFYLIPRSTTWMLTLLPHPQGVEIGAQSGLDSADWRDAGHDVVDNSYYSCHSVLPDAIDRIEASVGLSQKAVVLEPDIRACLALKTLLGTA